MCCRSLMSNSLKYISNTCCSTPGSVMNVTFMFVITFSTSAHIVALFIHVRRHVGLVCFKCSHFVSVHIDNTIEIKCAYH